MPPQPLTTEEIDEVITYLRHGLGRSVPASGGGGW
jgi:hypothetical protein